MKIAFTTTGTNLDAPLDPRFGRAPQFLIYDLDQNRFEIIDNSQNLNAAQGAGIQAATTICNHQAQAVITGHCGPKAFKVLNAANIAIYHSQAQTVGEALEQYRAGTLSAAEAANIEGHWV